MQARTRTFERLESEVRSYCRSFPVIFTRASGAHLYDEQGRGYLDFLSGAGSLNYGHNNPKLKQEIIAYLADDGVLHGLDMMTSAKKRFLDVFESKILHPREYNYKVQFTGPTGTNAVEAAMKLARKVTGRTNIVSFTNGFHGVTLGAVAATGNSHFRDASGVSLGNSSFMPYDGYMGTEVNTLEYLEQAIVDQSSGLDYPAALIVETVQGEGGVNVASLPWLKGLERICRTHEILLIVDDIQVGCGRTGSFFSFEDADITPDIVTLSKSLSGYGLPMSVVLMKPQLDQWLPSEHNGTFRGNNLAFVSATHALLEYWSDGNLSQSVRSKGALMRERLEDAAVSYPGVLEVRGRGMIQGLACDNPDHASAITEACFERGLIIETSGSQGQVVKFLPPLTISEEALERGLDIVLESLESVLAPSEAPVRASEVRS